MLFGYAGLASAVQDDNPLERASNAIKTLQEWFDQKKGLYNTTGWWNSANATTVLVDYSRISKTEEYNSTLANIFVAAQNTNLGFLNKYYDDEGWWALA